MRDTVRRLAGCLGDLPRREIRVLVLRAGIGPGPALSRERVGDRLDLATQRVARLERRGLRHLRAAASDGCGGAGAGTTVVATVLAAATGGSLPAAPGAERSADAGAGGSNGDEEQPRSGVKGEFDSSGDGGGTPAVSVPPVGADGGSAEGLSIAALLLGLLMLGYAVRRELRSGGGPTPG